MFVYFCSPKSVFILYTEYSYDANAMNTDRYQYRSRTYKIVIVHTFEIMFYKFFGVKHVYIYIVGWR